MCNFDILYRYEIKKLVKRKIVWVAAAITLVLSLMSVTSDVTGKYYVDGVVFDTHYHMMETDREYARALTGRAIDWQLINEMQTAYRKIPADEARYSLTDEYQTYARPYSQIFHIVRKRMGFSDWQQMCDWKTDEGVFYDNLAENVEEMCRNNFLTKGEQAYWLEKVKSLKKPLIFGYADGYWKLISSSYTICFILLFSCAVCLSDLYTKEHTLRTDQLLLSSRFGKKQIYWAKALAGMSFAGVSALVIGIIAIVTTLGIYGTDGFSVMIQNAAVDYPLPLTAGWVVVVMFGLMVLAALFTAVLAMIFSEFLHSGVAALAVTGSIILVPIFVKIPPQYRVIAQIWSYLPSSFLNEDTIFSFRLLPFFGGYLSMWYAVPIIYILLGGVFLFFGKRIYQKYQVSGR